MIIKKPIILFSIGRSGSTVFHRMVSQHPKVSYLSTLCSRFPRKPELNAYLMHLIDLPGGGPWLRSRLHPVEVYPFFDVYYPGFSRPCRDLTGADLTNHAREGLQSALSRAVSEHKPRLLIKITGWPRIGFLKELFPDALFVHLIRDGRAVANSFLKRDFWKGWGGPHKWRWGELNPADRESWLLYDRSFIALAAIQWNIFLEAVEHTRNLAGKNYYQLRYEDLCAQPAKEMERLCSFLDLDWGNEFAGQIHTHQLRNSNEKWQRDFTESQITIAQELMFQNLQKYRYI